MVSVSTHVLIVTVMTGFLLERNELRLEEPLDLRWLTAREVEQNESSRAPVRISSVPDGTPTNPMPPAPPPETPVPTPATRPAVDPVDVSGRLALRTPDLRRKQ